jgi:hypothetical protein
MGNVGRAQSFGFALSNKGYLGGGVDNSSHYQNDFLEYDPSNDLWIQKNNFAGLARKGAVGFSIDTKGYMGTGFDGSFQKDFWMYNPNGNGIENVENKIQVSASPNPFSSVCIIEIKNDKQEIINAECVLYDVKGNKIKTISPSLKANSFVLDRAGLMSGVYFYRIQSGNKVLYNGKLVIQ